MVVVKLRKYNVEPDHFQRIESREDDRRLDNKLPDAHLFRIEEISYQLANIAEFLTWGQAPMGYIPSQCHQLVTHSVDYQLIARKLYNMEGDDILRLSSLENEWDPILNEAYKGIIGGNNSSKATTWKLLHIGI
jgi:hypothetical protein